MPEPKFSPRKENDQQLSENKARLDSSGSTISEYIDLVRDAAWGSDEEGKEKTAGDVKEELVLVELLSRLDQRDTEIIARIDAIWTMCLASRIHMYEDINQIADTTVYDNIIAALSTKKGIAAIVGLLIYVATTIFSSGVFPK